ncbi:MAG TPA: M20 family metallopeptidase [Acidimicrobiales bacterium]|nr:M20 family metallopeptidase [Acidimicrobiales bacterium]
MRRQLHRRAESGFHLPETQQAILDSLEGLPLSIHLGKSLTSVVAVLDGSSSTRTLLLRADMDALDITEDSGVPFASEHHSIMHACGHDAHTAMLVGAARLLCHYREHLCGKVVFMFQPGEERGAGASRMLAEGLLEITDRPGAAFALHVRPDMSPGVVGIRSGVIMGSSDAFRIHVTGRGGHIAAPDLAVDPIPIACEIVLALQTMVAREVNAFNATVVTITRIDGGNSLGAIPESVTLHGNLRAVSEQNRVATLAAIRRVADGVARAHRARAELDVIAGYPMTVNDSHLTALVRAVVGTLGGSGQIFELPQPVLLAEDFSYILREVPGVLAFLGVAPSAEGSEPLHSSRMVLDEDAMAIGVALHAGVAVRYFGEG